MKCLTTKKIACIFVSITISIFSLNSCYYDSEEYLYGDSTNCDTQNITYQNFVNSLMQSKCNSCHNQTTPSGNVITSNYSDLMIIVNNGKLRGVTNHSPGFSPMPKGQNKLPDCDIAKLNAWIDSGAPEQ